MATIQENSTMLSQIVDQMFPQNNQEEVEVTELRESLSKMEIDPCYEPDLNPEEPMEVDESLDGLLYDDVQEKLLGDELHKLEMDYGSYMIGPTVDDRAMLKDLKKRTIVVDELEAMNRLVTKKHINLSVKFEVEDGEFIVWTCTLIVKGDDYSFVTVQQSQNKKRSKYLAACELINDLIEKRHLWLVDVGFLGGTFIDDNYEAHGLIGGLLGTVGSVAGAVSNVAGSVSGIVPGAGLVSDVAGGVENLFSGSGSSDGSASNQDRPTVPIDYPTATLQQVGQFSLGDGPINANTLRLAKDKITPHGGLLPKQNDMTVNNLKQIEGMIARFKINSSTRVNSKLHTFKVSPVQEGSQTFEMDVAGQKVKTSTECPLTNLARHFAYYSGDMKLKFYVGSAQPHSFRIRISQIPDDVGDEDAIAEGAFHHVDITVEEQTEFEFIVRNMTPFAQNLIWYSPHGNLGSALKISKSPKPYYYGNVVITALTPLRTTGVTASEITVSVMLSGAENFEFSVPTVSKCVHIPKHLLEYKAHVGSESISSADAGGISQLGGDAAEDTMVTTAREMSESVAVEQPTNSQIVDQYFSGTKSEASLFTDRYIQFGSLEIDTTQTAGSVIYKSVLPRDIIKQITTTPNVLQLRQFAFFRPSLTLQVKCNSAPFNGGTVVVAIRYFESNRNSANSNVRSVDDLIQMHHTKISLAACNDAYIEIPYENYMHIIPTTDNYIGLGQYYVSMFVGILNPLALAEGTSNPILTFFAKFSTSSENTTFYGMRDYYDAHMESQGEERSEDKAVMDPITAEAKSHTERLNGETFDLKSMCRRMNKILGGRVQMDNNIDLARINEVFTAAGIEGQVDPTLPNTNVVVADFKPKDPVIVVSLPNHYSTLPIYQVNGKIDLLGPKKDALIMESALKKVPLMEHLSGAYRFGRGSLRYAIQWHCDSPCRMYYRHNPEQLDPVYRRVLKAGLPVGGYDYANNRSFTETKIVVEDLSDDPENIALQVGEAFEIQDYSYNGSVIFDVPFYSPPKSLINNLTREELSMYNYAGYCFGSTEFVFKPIKEDAVVSFDIWRSLGDDADFSIFQGFPVNTLP